MTHYLYVHMHTSDIKPVKMIDSRNIDVFTTDNKAL